MEKSFLERENCSWNCFLACAILGSIAMDMLWIWGQIETKNNFCWIHWRTWRNWMSLLSLHCGLSCTTVSHSQDPLIKISKYLFYQTEWSRRVFRRGALTWVLHCPPHFLPTDISFWSSRVEQKSFQEGCIDKGFCTALPIQITRCNKEGKVNKQIF